MTGLAAVMTENLPILQVILPMLTAPLCLLLRHRRVTWLLAMLVSWTTLGISWLLFQQVRADGPISYFAGGWEPPWGIELRLEPTNALLLLVVSGISSVVLAAAPRSFDSEISHHRHHYLYAAFLLCMTGLLGMASAGDAFNVFVFLEISSLSSYSLIAMGSNRRALTS
ncbi:MAG: monovalent cation/H+ antiporter subunit D family protein, partial [Acidobacteriota bacterium]